MDKRVRSSRHGEPRFPLSRLPGARVLRPQSGSATHMMPRARNLHSLFLLISILFFLLLNSFVGDEPWEVALLAVAMYVTLVAATWGLSVEKSLRWPAILLAASSMLVTLGALLLQTRALWIANWLFLALFYGFVSITLFNYLGRPGAITSDHLFASVNVYFLLGLFYDATFNLIQMLRPGSFVEAGLPAGAPISRHSLFYFSLVTLTTLGYGDVLPKSPLARTVAALEAITGVLYIAITVARLVAAYQRTESREG